MTQIRRVLLCGKSLLISGLQATLLNSQGLDLQLVEPHPDRLLERLRKWQPDILILESTLLNSNLLLPLLCEFPDLKLIGLDIEDNRLLVFSGQTTYAPTIGDLIQAIEA